MANFPKRQKTSSGSTLQTFPHLYTNLSSCSTFTSNTGNPDPLRSRSFFFDLRMSTCFQSRFRFFWPVSTGVSAPEKKEERPPKKRCPLPTGGSVAPETALWRPKQCAATALPVDAFRAAARGFRFVIENRCGGSGRHRRFNDVSRLGQVSGAERMTREEWPKVVNEKQRPGVRGFLIGRARGCFFVECGRWADVGQTADRAELVRVIRITWLHPLLLFFVLRILFTRKTE